MRINEIHNYSFGITSAIMTSLAVIIGLSWATNNLTIIATLLIIAIADNVSDSFGMHVYQESKNISSKEVKKTTTNNFIARILTTLVFILFVIILSTNLAVIISTIFGLTVLVIISYFISLNRNINPYYMTSRHLALAIILMVSSFVLRYVILTIFSSFIK